MKRNDLAKKISQILGDYLFSIYKSKHKEIAKEGKDFVLAADLEAERKAIIEIRKHFPDDNILSEEQGGISGKNDYKWIIDPLDGTVNFKYRIPYFCTSVAIERKGKVISSVVYNPINKQLFYAKKGGGAYLNNKSMRISKTKNLKNAFISYSTSNHKDKDVIVLGSHLFNGILLNCRAIRLRGSSLLDLCNLALGSFDGLIKISGNYWDYAAGKLIVEEAGGKVTDFDGQKPRGTSDIIASNKTLHPKLAEVVSQFRHE